MRCSIVVIDSAITTLLPLRSRCVLQRNSVRLALPAEKRQLISTAGCHQRFPLPPAPSARRPPRQSFATSTHLLKKGGKQENKRNADIAAVDPFDFTELEAGIQRALDQLKEDLSKLRAGGRFNPDFLEALRVHLVKGSKETVRLGDLAQAVPRGGRTIVVLVGEAE
ncbi:MAG: hypothetical protein Q9187_002426, partial [Circinaria calcarea]